MNRDGEVFLSIERYALMRVKIDGDKKEIRSVWFEKGRVLMIDQRKLPLSLEIKGLGTVDEVCISIREMWVRGAPAIGITAAYGMAIASLTGEDVKSAAEKLKATRPTAFDLFYAVDYMLEKINIGDDPVVAAEEYANIIIEKCRSIGNEGAPLIKDGFRILTHCNAGALATGDYGTSLSPIRTAFSEGKIIFVFVDETRPRLQGARLTAWELYQEGVPHAVIADNAAGHYMRTGQIDMVIVGADRIAGNGDFANKIGTYEKAVIAKENGIPFYVAAPASTFDLSLPGGGKIPIEERDEKEVLEFGGVRIAPHGSSARNPAFDVTPARYVTGFITEYGVFTPEELPSLILIIKGRGE